MIALRRLYDRAVAGPDYPPNDADLRDIRVLGLALPLRATVAVVAATGLIVLDQLQVGVFDSASPFDAVGLVPVTVERFIWFLAVPFLVVVSMFQDAPSRYGLTLGDWRWGVVLLAVGLAVMTPIILGFASNPAFRAFYGATTTPIGVALANNVVELFSAEFLLRGFLMFTLWRRIGPLALIVQLLPFVLTHVGKPEIELWSTFIGGSVFAWLDWRTGSILWSALGHVYVLTLMLVAVGGATLS